MQGNITLIINGQAVFVPLNWLLEIELMERKMLIDEPMNNIPHNWENPDFSNKVHNWVRYVDDEVAVLWGEFSDEAKQALAQNFNGISDMEEWD